MVFFLCFLQASQEMSVGETLFSICSSAHVHWHSPLQALALNLRCQACQKGTWLPHHQPIMVWPKKRIRGRPSQLVRRSLCNNSPKSVMCFFFTLMLRKIPVQHWHTWAGQGESIPGHHPVGVVGVPCCCPFLPSSGTSGRCKKASLPVFT